LHAALDRQAGGPARKPVTHFGARGSQPLLPRACPSPGGGHGACSGRPPMKLRWLSRRAREILAEAALREPEAEIDRLLVAAAVAVRDGEHFRIESGDDSWTELEAHAKRLQGLCDCGAILSVNTKRAHCRACGREYAVS